jgi:hypothetical protein
MQFLTWLFKVLAIIITGFGTIIGLLVHLNASPKYQESILRGKLERICDSDYTDYYFREDRHRVCRRMSKLRMVTNRYDFENLIWIEDHTGEVRNEKMTRY